MKVYAVINDVCCTGTDDPVSGVFLDRKDAEKRLIEEAVKDFENNAIPTGDKHCHYENGELYYICDDSYGYVGWFIQETELM